MTAVAPKARIKPLDLLRGVAILLVLGNHLESPDKISHHTPTAFIGLHTLGWVGVDLFFVLSGFLVAGLLFKGVVATGTTDVRRFLIRRAFKILPPYYVTLLVAYPLFILTHPRGPVHSWYLSDLLFLQSYIPNVLLSLWSISVEEHFYWLLAAITFIHLYRSKKRGEVPTFSFIPALFGGVAVYCLTMRCWRGLANPVYEFSYHMSPTHLRIDSLLCGVTLAYFSYFRPDVFKKLSARPGWLMFVGTVAILAVTVHPREMIWVTNIGLTITMLGSAAVLLGALQMPNVPRVLSPLSAIGFYSYTIYLFHLFAKILAQTLINRDLSAAHWWSYTFAYVAFGIAMGVIVSKLVEIPALRLRDRLFPDAMPVQNQASIADESAPLDQPEFADEISEHPLPATGYSESSPPAL